jgi:two-component system, sensor histidine kinase
MNTRRILLEVFILLVVFGAGVFVLIVLDAFEFFYHFTRAHESWELDDLLLSTPLLILCMLVFIAFRLRDARREAHQCRIAEEKARAAEAEAVLMQKVKEEFLAIMSHELRTPLNGIIGTLTLVSDEDIPPDKQEFVELALEGGRSLNALLSDVLEFSRLSHCRIEETTASFSPRELALSVYYALLPAAQAKGVTLSKPEAIDLPATVEGMKGPLRQILLNVTGNAVKFTEHGRVAVRCYSKSQGNGLDRLVFEVSDTGPGIPAEDHAKIFEPFTQRDGSLCRREGGIGLGLSLVKRLVDLLDGTITLVSDLGQGATFRISVPVKSSTETCETESITSAV